MVVLPGLKSLMLAWLDVSCHVPGAKTIGQAVDKKVKVAEDADSFICD